MTVAIRPPIPYFGGKMLIGPAIAALLPEHAHYVEPYCGSAGSGDAMTLDLDRIRRDANTAGKYVDDSIGTRVLKRDVPALCDEVERLRAERFDLLRWQEDASERLFFATSDCDRGYRQAIADLRDGDAFMTWYRSSAGRKAMSDRTYSEISADFLESRLTKEPA